MATSIDAQLEGYPPVFGRGNYLVARDERGQKMRSVWRRTNVVEDGRNVYERFMIVTLKPYRDWRFENNVDEFTLDELKVDEVLSSFARETTTRRDHADKAFEFVGRQVFARDTLYGWYDANKNKTSAPLTADEAAGFAWFFRIEELPPVVAPAPAAQPAQPAAPPAWAVPQPAWAAPQPAAPPQPALVQPLPQFVALADEQNLAIIPVESTYENFDQNSAISSVASFPDDRIAVAASRNNGQTHTIYVLNDTNAAHQWITTSSFNSNLYVRSMLALPGDCIVTVTGMEGRVSVWKRGFGGAAPVLWLEQIYVGVGHLHAASLAPLYYGGEIQPDAFVSGREGYVGRSSLNIVRWNAAGQYWQTSDTLKHKSPDRGSITALASFPDGRIVSASHGTQVWTQRHGDGKWQTSGRFAKFDVGGQEVFLRTTTLAVLPRGRIAACYLGKDFVVVWKPVGPNWSEDGRLPRPGTRASMLVALPNNRLVVVYTNGSILMWRALYNHGNDTTAWQKEFFLLNNNMPFHPPHYLAALPDGRLAVGTRGTMRVWRLPEAAPAAAAAVGAEAAVAPQCAACSADPAFEEESTGRAFCDADCQLAFYGRKMGV